MGDSHPAASVGGLPGVVIGPGAKNGDGATYVVKVGDRVTIRVATGSPLAGKPGHVVSWAGAWVTIRLDGTDRLVPCDPTSLAPLHSAPHYGSQTAPQRPTEASLPSLDKLAEEVTALVRERHAKYGPKNIANAPGGAINGLTVRLHDKVARLGHSSADHADESLRDTFMDIVGYGLIGLMVLNGEWPQ